MARKTVFQQLSDLFGPERAQRSNKSRYSLNDKELLKTQSKEEYDYELLQRQQDAYLANQWKKVDNEIYQHSIYYETTRLASYADFEGMEFFPEIAAALDIFMEESTTPNGEGRILNIFSESKRVRRILQDLFFNRLDIHTNLPMWVRNTCKYGDNFLYLTIDSEDGVQGVKQLPNIEVSRKENDGFGENASTKESDKFNPVKFVWGQKDMEFNAWQVAHFRLLGDDRRLPYGTSILEKARRIWKQLLLSEDAMLIYRVTRAPERRIFKIFVGNIDEKDVPAYVNKIADNFKRSPVIDQQTGQIDTRYNQMAQDQDYFVPVRDPNAPSPIDTLPGATNLSEIADIQFLQKKLFTALRVPKPFLGFEEVTGEGKNLALQDIRFARTVERIQRILVSELTKIALVHLYAQGYDGAALTNFELSLTTPSIIYDQERIALMKEKVELAGNMIEQKLMPTDWIYDNIFHFSEDQYQEYRDLIIEDQKRRFRENQIESEGNDPAESGEAYGTPHSLASLYGAGRYPGSKGVPSGYAVGDKNYPETVLDQGRPAEGPSDYGQQDSNLGKDVTGSQRMKSSNQAEDRPGLNETKKSKKK